MASVGTRRLSAVSRQNRGSERLRQREIAYSGAGKSPPQRLMCKRAGMDGLRSRPCIPVRPPCACAGANLNPELEITRSGETDTRVHPSPCTVHHINEQ